MKDDTSIMETMRTRHEILEKLIRRKKEELKRAPEGRIRISQSNGKPRFYHCMDHDSDGVYIQKQNQDLIRSLAQKSYDKKVLSAAIKEKKAIDQYLANVPGTGVEGVFREMSETRQKYVAPVFETDEAFRQRWMSQPYPSGVKRGEHAVVYNDQGLALDSKAELMIAAQFDKRNIAYLPQFPLSLRGYGTVIADFKAVNVRTRKEFFWEHLGMLDSEEYRRRNLPKLNAYIMNGFIPGENLILTWESGESRLDMRVVDRLINTFLI